MGRRGHSVAPKKARELASLNKNRTGTKNKSPLTGDGAQLLPEAKLTMAARVPANAAKWIVRYLRSTGITVPEYKSANIEENGVQTLLCEF